MQAASLHACCTLQVPPKHHLAAPSAAAIAPEELGLRARLVGGDAAVVVAEHANRLFDRWVGRAGLHRLQPAGGVGGRATGDVPRPEGQARYLTSTLLPARRLFLELTARKSGMRRSAACSLAVLSGRSAEWVSVGAVARPGLTRGSPLQLEAEDGRVLVPLWNVARARPRMAVEAANCEEDEPLRLCAAGAGPRTAQQRRRSRG